MGVFNATMAMRIDLLGEISIVEAKCYAWNKPSGMTSYQKQRILFDKFVFVVSEQLWTKIRPYRDI